MFAIGSAELAIIVLMLAGATVVPLAIVVVVRAVAAGSADAGHSDTVVAAARRGRVVSASAGAAYAGALLVLVVMAIPGRRVGLLAAAPLLAAAVGMAVLLVAGRAAAREASGPRRTAALNARTPELIVKTGWHLVLLVGTVALVVVQLLVQVRRRHAAPSLTDAPLAAQVIGFAAVILLWAVLSRRAVLRPALARAPVDVDNALRRSDAARATRLAAVGMTQALGCDLLVLAALADGPGAGRAGAGALGVLLVAAGPWLWAFPSARLPRVLAPAPPSQPVA